MAATACLQIVIKNQRSATTGIDVLHTVAKVTTAFLEFRWSWPRKFDLVTQTSYLLTDPTAAAIDAAEVQLLSNKLQLRLFGVSDTGEVSIAAFEGTQGEVVRFSKLSSAEVAQLMNGGSMEALGFRGKLTKLTSREASVVHEPTATTTEAAPPQTNEPKILYRGVYLLPKQEFVGCLASRWRQDDAHRQSVLNALEEYPVDNSETFDRETIAGIAKALAHSPPRSLIFVPISYTALARPGMRERYQDHLAPLRQLPKALLVARIYNVPRNPQLSVLSQMKSLLESYVALVDIAVADPGIDISALGSGIVRGVALVLPTADDTLRAAAINRFMTNKERFRTQHLWPGIGNIRTRKEVLQVSALKVAFMGGPAVCDIMDTPLPVLPYLVEGLPLTAVRQ